MLVGLGGSPSKVAAHLDGLGVKGKPACLGGCPVARFLSAIVASEPRVRRVRVFRRVAVVSQKRGLPWVVVALPEPVRTFVAAFDAGVFPQLVWTDRPEAIGRAQSPATRNHVVPED
ncbi:MAG: hypothetical protein ACRD0B_02830 [Acidimicrobiales bacterium]